MNAKTQPNETNAIKIRISLEITNVLKNPGSSPTPDSRILKITRSFVAAEGMTSRGRGGGKNSREMSS